MIRREADQIILKCYNNLAASLLNGPGRDADAYLRAAEYCEKVLVKEPDNSKARFRKAQALAKAGAHEKAIEVFRLCPQNAEVRKQIQLCQHEIDTDRKRRGEEIRRNFERAQQKQAAREAVARMGAAAAPAAGADAGPSQFNGVVHLPAEGSEEENQQPGNGGEVAVSLPNGDVH